MCKESFVFYRAFFDAIKDMDDATCASCFRALCEYGLDGNSEPENMIAKAILTMAKPTIDANMKRYEASMKNGKQGGRPKTQTEKMETQENLEKPNHNLEKPNHNLEKPNHNLEKPRKTKAEKTETQENLGVKNQNLTVTDTVTVTDTDTDTVTEKEKEKVEKEKNTPTRLNPQAEIDSKGFSEPLADKVKEWVQYKQERKESYKPTGLKNLLTIIADKVDTHGDKAVIDLIGLCMSQGWKGIIWDKLGNGGNASGGHKDAAAKAEGGGRFAGYAGLEL